MLLPRHTIAKLAVIGLLACSPDGASDAPAAAAPAATPAQVSGAPDAPPSDAPPAAAGNTKPLPDLTQDLLSGACENGPGKEGADSHFFGMFKFNGDTVSGDERQIFHANAHWKKRGGSDCTITWHVSGSKVNTKACADCDYGLMLTGEPDIEGSDCVEGLVKADAKRQELRYDVKLQPDGTAFIYFAKSGKRLGQGYYNANAVTWVSQHQCKWF
jgi:hypothetical protein